MSRTWKDARAFTGFLLDLANATPEKRLIRNIGKRLEWVSTNTCVIRDIANCIDKKDLYGAFYRLYQCNSINPTDVSAIEAVYRQCQLSNLFQMIADGKKIPFDHPDFSSEAWIELRKDLNSDLSDNLDIVKLVLLDHISPDCWEDFESGKEISMALEYLRKNDRQGLTVLYDHLLINGISSAIDDIESSIYRSEFHSVVPTPKKVIPKLLFKDSFKNTSSIDSSSKGSSSKDECAICLVDKPDTVFMPCKHLLCCKGCSEEVDHCPVCRTKITSKITFINSCS